MTQSEAQIQQRLRAVEIAAAKKRAQTHCKNGHEFTPENTSIRKNGSRACKICGIMTLFGYKLRKE